jgi:myosin protein heavy chain
LKDLERNSINILYLDSYWIAERYFNGEFVKYNNNFGFISDDPSDINNLA